MPNMGFHDTYLFCDFLGYRAVYQVPIFNFITYEWRNGGSFEEEGGSSA